MAVTISRAVRDALIAEAGAMPDVEICGLLLGSAGRIEAIMPTTNVSPTPEHSFEIDPAILIATHRAARAGGLPIQGNYHSHPNGNAEPSARDAANAQAGELWLIVTASEASLWRFDGTIFRAESLDASDEESLT